MPPALAVFKIKLASVLVEISPAARERCGRKNLALRPKMARHVGQDDPYLADTALDYALPRLLLWLLDSPSKVVPRRPAARSLGQGVVVRI